MARQLTFDLPAKHALGREDFFVAPPNAQAVAMLENWQAWPNHKMVLIGPPGSGKTHLAHVWAADTGASVINGADLHPADVPALVDKGPVAIDGADTPGMDETALFHLHNLILAEGHPFLITATQPPSRWGTQLPDLASRMQGTSVIELEPPDDTLLQAVMVKLFSDRQIDVSPEVVTYLLSRIERSFSEAQDIVDLLDKEALAEGRALTRPLAARVLDKLGS
jgi:chromosomal replication initiation ATPase DnaA